MQTFLPYRSYVQSARVLDRQRLGKQRVEVLQILRTLLGESDGWKNHPAVKMWRGYESSLAQYGIIICWEWRENRGYKDACSPKILNLAIKHHLNPLLREKKPHWLDDDFIRAYRSNLLRKDPEFYGQYEWDVPHDLPYIWPEGKEGR